MSKINEVIKNKYNNHIMPFLWMHGEEESVIRHYIKKINEAGIKSVCIESRPHEQFLKEKWWLDVDVIVEECEKLGMTLWILDDKHFPTGYAAGIIKEKYPQLQKVFLCTYQLDVIGPRKNSGVLIKWTTRDRPNFMSVGTEMYMDTEQATSINKIVSVVAAPKTGYKKIEDSQLIDLTQNVNGDMLYWDIPDGEWSIFVNYETQNGGEKATEGYLNPIDPSATDILISEIYATHYERYKEKFGSTILGFFSDEPRFGNIKGGDASIGRVDMPLPWRKNLEIEFSNYLGINVDEVKLKLPLLQRGTSSEANAFRYSYMNFITDLYQKNFTNRIGQWCKDRNIDYIGHVIEDNNAHSRLGYGSGHFFKSMTGQTMSGLDVVLHQLMPDQKNYYNKSMTSAGWDGEFFHFAMAKMGASLSYLEPHMMGRTMCEVFGAYGWAEGTKMMKWIADHLLSRGVNYFVPHAFTMSDFPDSDCPPHFYAQGNNPQFKGFGKLMEYMNRISTLFSNGKHMADIAVLYHGEAEWSGNYMPFQKITRVLTENQYEFNVIPCNSVLDSVVNEHFASIHMIDYKVLIIPFSERLPQNVLLKLKLLQENGIEVIFIENLPTENSENISGGSVIPELKKISKCLKLNDMKNYIDSIKLDKLELLNSNMNIRYFHYQVNDIDQYIIFNESMLNTAKIKFKLSEKNQVSRYDASTNKLSKLNSINNLFEVELERGESLILIDDINPTIFGDKTSEYRHDISNSIWSVSIDSGFECNEYNKVFNGLPILGQGDELEGFSGTITYKTTVEVDELMRISGLKISEANEVVTAYINGKEVDTRISYPYYFDVENYFVNGVNEIKIEVVNSLAMKMKDFLSQYMPFDALGINGNIYLEYYDNKE